MFSIKRIQEEFSLIGLIKAGSFGSVYAAKDKKGQIYAVKILHEQIPKSKRHFLFFQKNKSFKEGKIFSMLQKIPGIPKLYYFGENPSTNSYMLVTELLGDDLRLEFMKKKMFSSEFIAKIGVQLIDILMAIHNKNVVHCDIKPDNILLSHHQTDQFYLVDFGLASFIKKSQEKNFCNFIGNIIYAACDSHFFEYPQKKHDLESLGYVLLFFILGFLPWQEIKIDDFNEKIHQVGVRKQKFLQHELDSIPPSLANFFKYLQKLQHSDKIDYVYLKKLMSSLKNEVNDPTMKSFCFSNTTPASKNDCEISVDDSRGCLLICSIY